MSKYPQTDLLDVPALHWHHVYTDLLALSSTVPADESYSNETTITAYVECFKRADNMYHWEILQGTEEMADGWNETLEGSIEFCESMFDTFLKGMKIQAAERTDKS